MSDMVDIDFSDPVMMEVLEHLIPPINSAWNHELNIQAAYKEAYKVSKKSPQALPAWEDLGTTMRDLWRERYAQTQRDYATGSGSESNRKPDPVYVAFCQAAIRMAPKRNLMALLAEEGEPAGEPADDIVLLASEVKTAQEVKTATNLQVHTPGARSKKGPSK